MGRGRSSRNQDATPTGDRVLERRVDAFERGNLLAPAVRRRSRDRRAALALLLFERRQLGEQPVAPRLELAALPSRGACASRRTERAHAAGHKDQDRERQRQRCAARSADAAGPRTQASDTCPGRHRRRRGRRCRSARRPASRAARDLRRRQLHLADLLRDHRQLVSGAGSVCAMTSSSSPSGMVYANCTMVCPERTGRRS